ncbi:hypothetical protein [Clostridium sp. B9]|uniref:hypothetical protein n=1 Tax=Clostridium sp. B9 TaxID=3423224 RepID=UPI003D2EE7FF
MYCNFKKDNCVRCKFNLKSFGTYDPARVIIDGSDRTQLNWSEISVPEVLPIPIQKPDMEQLDQVYVDAKLTCVKLIETPFAYNSYDRLATTYEIDSATAALADASAIDADVQTVLTDADAVLAVPPPVVPEVTAFQMARDAVEAANTNLTNAIADATAVLGGTCVCAADVVAAMEAVISATQVLETTLNDLVTAGANLDAASNDAAVTTAIATMNADIIIAIATIDTAQASLADVITLVGNTKYFEIIENEEGVCLSGRKLVIEGVLSQKVVYTGLVTTQSVHSACYEVPFTAYIIPYAKFEGLTYEEDVEVITDKATCTTTTINGFAYNPDEPIQVDICEEFCVDALVEDIFATMLNCRTIFKNVTVFLIAKPVPPC